jgi:N-formylglutamate deformylase
MSAAADWWAPWAAAEDFRLWPGSAPLLVSLPHDGTAVPEPIAERMSDAARAVPDTDWHVARLYDFARELGASVIRPRWSRYVIDLNRPPDGTPLYPGRQETGLCPTVRFDFGPVYRSGEEPTQAEVEARRERWWRPYHQALAAELARLRERHGRVLLWEGHSIRSQCPMFFPGRLPDYNLGTAEGSSCSPEIGAALAATLAGSGVSHVVDGRFKGGYITRHYGRPADGIHAVQMEMAQSSYLDEADPGAFQPQLAAPAQEVLRRLVEAAVEAL